MKTMKDIKPYLHLYLNAQVQVRKKNDKDREYLIGRVCEVTSGSNHGDWIKVWFDDCHTVTNDTWNELTSNAHHFFINHDEIKLILRRLSDMSEEDFKEFSKPKSFDTYGGYWYACDREIDPEFEGDVIEHINEACDADPENVIMCHIKSKTISYGWIEYDERYHGFSTEDEAKWIMFLLSRSFDLFGLIDSGLAIDAKTVNQTT